MAKKLRSRCWWSWVCSVEPSSCREYSCPTSSRWSLPGLPAGPGQAFTAATAPGTHYVAGRGHGDEQKAGTRILVFGASAAYGEMFGPLTAFPGQAEARLRKANPEHPEVLNLAHGGMGSQQVSEMVFRALENDNPDLIVVYTGNNEYHELHHRSAL